MRKLFNSDGDLNVKALLFLLSAVLKHGHFQACAKHQICSSHSFKCSSDNLSHLVLFPLFVPLFACTHCHIPLCCLATFSHRQFPLQSSHSLPRRWLLAPKNGSAPLLGCPVEINLSGAPSFLSLVLLCGPASSIYMLNLTYTQRRTVNTLSKVEAQLHVL